MNIINKLTLRLLSTLFFLSFSLPVFADVINVIDDEGILLQFKNPLTRIISLSPHATELMFAAGASDQIKATVSYSDYPPAAKQIPRIGSYKKIDLESLVKMQPDLVIVWKGGGSTEQIEDIKRLGFTVYHSEPRSFDDVAKNIINMGKLLGTNGIALKQADLYTKKLLSLKRQYQKNEIVDVFYQVWNTPLISINKDHLITDVIEFCGGRNVFANVSARAPRVSIESVINENPQAIIIGINDKRLTWAEEWNKWQEITAVKNKHVYTVNADYIVRQGPRIVQGVETVCKQLQQVRDINKNKTESN